MLRKVFARLLVNNRPSRLIFAPRRTRLEAEPLGDRIVPTPLITVEWIADAAEGGDDGVVRFTRTGDTSELFVVDVAITGGTATPGDDYEPSVIYGVTFEAGHSTADLAITAEDDSTSEPTEGVVVSVAAPGFMASGPYDIGTAGSATVGILDNDTPVVSVDRMYDATEGVNSGFFSLVRIGDLTNSLTVNITVSGTATNGTDYTTIGTTATFAAGAAEAVVEVDANTDSGYDPDETVILTAGTGTGYTVGTPAGATLTIEDAIPLVSVVKVADSTEDGTDGYLRFTRTGDLTGSLTIDYTVGGTATSGTDFTTRAGSVTFAAGESEVLVPLTTTDDTSADPGEVVTATLSPETGYVVGIGSATVLIVDDESPVVTVTKIADAFEGGADGMFRFDRTGDLTNSLTVSYTVSGTATGGTDYSSLSETVTIAAAEQSAVVSVVPTNDTATEGTETVIVAVTSDTNYGAAPDSVVTMSISDNDGTNGQIGGVVWEDEDGDGTRDTGEAVLAGQGVSLLNEGGDYLLNTVTDANGEYVFTGLAEGTYYTKVFPPALYRYADQDQGSDEAADSDIDSETGQSDPITLTTQSVTNLLIGTGFTKIVPPEQPPTGTILVNFTYPDGSPLVTNGELKVAKWSDAFEGDPTFADKTTPRVRGPVNGVDFIDRDPDRFNVWVYDLATWNNNTQHITVTLSTSNAAGFAGYNDDATTISLVRINQETGWYWSESQLLVSNVTDDKYADPDAPYIQKDNAVPSTTRKHINGQFTSDRTHLIALGGTITAAYTVGGQTYPKTATVPLEKKVKLNITIMRDDAAANGGKLAVTDAVVDQAVKTAREIFAQVGIGVEVVAAYQKKDPPANLDLSNGLEEYPDQFVNGQIQLSDKEKLLLPEFRTETQTDIEVYYVKKLYRVVGGNIRAGSSGEAFPLSAMQNRPQLAHSIVLNGQDTKPFHLAHEIIHLLTNSINHWGQNVLQPTANERTNLMAIGSKQIQVGDYVNNEFVLNDMVIASRRLSVAQQFLINMNLLLSLLHSPE